MPSTSIVFPKTLPMKNLKVTNPEYSAVTINRHQALYEGGALFRTMIDTFLTRRQVEGPGSPIKNPEDLYRDRLKWAPYANHVGSVFDWIAASVFPFAEVHADDDPDGYYASLNDDADGNGSMLVSILRQAFIQSIVNKRAYFITHFPYREITPSNPDSMKFRIRSIPAINLDDWQFQEDDQGKLEWVRVAAKYKKRPSSNSILPAAQEVKTWTYITEDGLHEYKHVNAKKEQGGGKDATLQPMVPVDWGELPVYDVKTVDALWMMDSVEDVATALYNAESGISYSLMRTAYAQTVLNLDETTEIKDIVQSEVCGVRLGIDEEISYLTPDYRTFKPQFENIQRLENSFQGVLQAIAKDAGNIPQIGRSSGEAIKEIKEPMQVFFKALGWPIISTFKRWLKAVKKNRKEEDKKVDILLPKSYSASIEEMRKAAQFKSSSEGKDNGNKETGREEGGEGESEEGSQGGGAAGGQG
jgi:hypothetical protein